MFSSPLCKHMKGIFVRDLNVWYLDMNLAFPSLSPILRRLFNYLSAKFENPIGSVLNAMEKVVDERIKSKGSEEYDDFIDAFLNLTTADSIQENDKRSKALSRDEIIAQCFLFVMAGFDTTASALSFVSHFLAMKPEVQDKARAEILAVMGKVPDLSKLGDLPYLDAIIKETLRIHPLAASTTGRRCTKTTVVGGISIERGTYVQPDVYSIHFDEGIWGADVSLFRPERWQEDTVPTRGSTFLSFGAGPRRCIGYRLAMMETKMVLVMMLLTFKIIATDETEEELSFLGSTTFSPASVTVKLESIHD
ncbi:hypothetical protein PFISCL1PPCAC_26345, partial [Pristionchus fissidentatus]